jgi:RNA polymerase sigma factor (TIGR02999 family)
MTAPDEITQLLEDWSEGDREALERLIPVVYDDLRHIARKHMRREDSGHTLQTTALVNEAYLRLEGGRVRWQNRAHFFAVASRAMRYILVDYARRSRYQKRGGGLRPLSLEDTAFVPREQSADLVALEEALRALAKIDPRRARVVELRYFGGLELKEVAVVLEVSPATVLRDWNLAKAWLYRQLGRGSEREDR